jgi:hypothetical protein
MLKGMLPNWVRNLCRVAGMIAVTVVPAVALAETSAQDRATAESLFNRGKALMAEGRVADACRSFADSQKLDAGVGTLLYLATCYEKLGRTASAWATFKDAEAAARVAGDVERAHLAAEHAAALEPNLPRLVVDVPPSSASWITKLTRDGSELPQSAWGVPMPVDPGEHTIQVTGSERAPWSTRVTAVAGNVVSVTIPALEPAQPAAAAAPPPERKEAETREGATWVKPVAFVAMGVGAVGLGVGTALGFSAKSKYDSAAPECDGSNVCSPAGYDQRIDARSDAATATVVFVAGLRC